MHVVLACLLAGVGVRCGILQLLNKTCGVLQEAKDATSSHLIAAIVSRRGKEASKAQATAKVKLTEPSKAGAEVKLTEPSKASAEVIPTEDGMAAVEDPIKPITKKTAEVHPLAAVCS